MGRTHLGFDLADATPAVTAAVARQRGVDYVEFAAANAALHLTANVGRNGRRSEAEGTQKRSFWVPA
jgi:hypothetical protein